MADYLHNKCCVFRPRFGEIYKVGTQDGSSEETLTYILQDETGAEYPAVLVDKEVVFDATANDIRLGKVAATGEGVTTGEKVIPSYHTTEAVRAVPVGSEFTIPLPDLDKYAYTKLQALICPFNTSMADSVSVQKVSILDKVYEANSVIEIATVVKDAETKSIKLGIKNDGTIPYIIRFFTYKEIY
jgi:hypothetical protein